MSSIQSQPTTFGQRVHQTLSYDPILEFGILAVETFVPSVLAAFIQSNAQTASDSAMIGEMAKIADLPYFPADPESRITAAGATAYASYMTPLRAALVEVAPVAMSVMIWGTVFTLAHNHLIVPLTEPLLRSGMALCFDDPDIGQYQMIMPIDVEWNLIGLTVNSMTGERTVELR